MEKDFVILANLKKFSGTSYFHKAMPGILLTDGTKYLADAAECHWLFDIIWSYLPAMKKKGLLSGIVKLTLDGHGGAEFNLFDFADAEDFPFIIQKISHTDFPLDEIELFVGAVDESMSKYTVCLLGER